MAAAAALVAALWVGCVEVDGGAVELSWTLRDFSGDPIREEDCGGDIRCVCEATRIGWIRLHWQIEGEGTGERAADGFWDFVCEDNRGATNFSVPPGRQLLWIAPICSDGSLPDSGYEAPPPILRVVDLGAVATLDALLIAVDECTCPGGGAACAGATSAPVGGPAFGAEVRYSR
ncbi:hypothetical protein [Haliangium sp.]|uniref:hypothetical protein n=1 Tax=Haliangium sp. TaxID=2663208 RepID=UPI003D0F9125